MLFIFVTIMLDMIGIGLIIPSLPGIMRRFGLDEASVSEYFGYFISIYACMQFFVSPLLGALSDRIGRRPVLLISLLIGGLDYLLMAFAPTLSILFIGRVISGLMGANITVAMAYIADVSTDENRSKNFGMIGAAFGLGFIIGPAIGGLLGSLGPQYPFIVAACINLINFLYGLFIIPESLPLDKRVAFKKQSLNPLHSLTKTLSVKGLFGFLTVYFLISLAGQTHPSIWTLYTQYRYHWDTAQIGWSLAMVGLLSAISQGWLTGKLVPKFGEARSVYIALVGAAITYVMFGLAPQGWMVYVILFLSSITWFGNPALQSMITKIAPATAQGELQGSLMSLASLSSILNPIIVTHLFSYFTGPTISTPIPGAPYFFAGAVSFIGCLIMVNKKSI